MERLGKILQLILCVRLEVIRKQVVLSRGL
jgi:hypothetical protein